MKKITLMIASIFCYGIMNAQTLLYDNGPLVNSPGMGTGGADVSNTHDGLTTYGFGHSTVAGFVVADDFTVPAGEIWSVDSIIFFAYQTNSTTTSPINEVTVAIWDASPASGGTVIYGDQTMNFLINSYWSNIYRTSETALTNTARPIMRNVTEMTGLVLTSGTYFVSWQTGGDAALTGPWAPPITIAGVTVTGDALQYDPTAMVWNPVIDAGATAAQGFPFILYGQISTGVNENNMATTSTLQVYPSPVKDIANFAFNAKSSGTYSIIVTDHLGKQVSERKIEARAGSNKITLDMRHEASGIYFVSASGNGEKINSKFVKE